MRQRFRASPASQRNQTKRLQSHKQSKIYYSYISARSCLNLHTSDRWDIEWVEYSHGGSIPLMWTCPRSPLALIQHWEAPKFTTVAATRSARHHLPSVAKLIVYSRKFDKFSIQFNIIYDLLLFSLDPHITPRLQTPSPGCRELPPSLGCQKMPNNPSSLDLSGRQPPSARPKPNCPLPNPSYLPGQPALSVRSLFLLGRGHSY